MTSKPLPAVEPLLEKIISPEDLRALSRRDLPALCAELRAFIIQSVSKTGGHLSSNLGVVELSVALHYVFNTPEDRIIWDVGHQTYAHKVLTKRRERFGTLRQKEGLSGFPSRAESEFDAFGTAHSSTSISAALGMAVAAKLSDEEKKRSIVAVIGDGAMTAGMAFEALNNAGAMKANLLVILNDNEMSISKPVGAFHNHLTRILTSPLYNTARDSGKVILRKIPPVKSFVKLMEEHTKGMLMPGTLFEEFGFFYVGPVDGHNIETLTKTLANAKEMKGPVLLHVVTRKGKGYALAEKEPVLYHGVSKFDPDIGIVPMETTPPETYSDVFGRWLCDYARHDEKLIGITPAMCEGSGMNAFAQAFPERYFDVGIAEQHAVTFAAGMACDGQKPVVAIYSTFLQRAYDQLIHDVALQNLPVVFAVDRAGIVGADGPTHIGAYDLSFLRCIPNVTIMTPADKAECYAMLSTAVVLKAPAVVRYPRGVAAEGANAVFDVTKTLPLGRGEIRRAGKSGVAILVFGTLLHEALKAAEDLDATVVNMRFVAPLDSDLVLELAKTHTKIVTLEENVTAGGAGSAVAEVLSSSGVTFSILHLGLPNRFIEHGAQDLLRKECGLDATGITRQIRTRWESLFNMTH